MLIKRWRNHYNHVRPHSAQGYKPPVPAAWVPRPSVQAAATPNGLLSNLITGTVSGGRALSDENLLGLGDSVDAITWEEILKDEESGRNRLRQIALWYPSDSAAQEASGAFADYIEIQNLSSAEATTRLRSSWLIVVLDAPSSEAATRALDRTFAKLAALKMPEGSS